MNNSMRLGFLLALLFVSASLREMIGRNGSARTRWGLAREGHYRKFPASGAKILWRTPIAAGYAGPAVAMVACMSTDRVAGVPCPGDPFQRGKYPGLSGFLHHSADGKVILAEGYSLRYNDELRGGPAGHAVHLRCKVLYAGRRGAIFAATKRQRRSGMVRKFKMTVADADVGLLGQPVIDGDKSFALHLQQHRIPSTEQRRDHLEKSERQGAGLLSTGDL